MPNSDCVYYSGWGWQSGRWQSKREVKWNDTLFQCLALAVMKDLEEYMKAMQLTPQKLPRPTVLIIMPLSRAGVPLHEFMHVLFDEGCRWPGIVQVCFPLKARGESIPIVHCLRHRRTLWVADQYIGDQSSLQPITIYGFLRRSCLHSCCSPLF